MMEKGLSEKQVLKELKNYKKLDCSYSSGKILGSMCTEPHPFAKKVYYEFLTTNLGDPGLFRGTSILEKETIQMLSSLLNAEKAYGNIVTGGTEANLMAMRAARNISNIEKPEIIVPASAHFSFNKASEILNLKLKIAKLDEEYKVNVESVKDKITSNTVAIVGIAGTTELGKVDPIPELSKLCEDENIYLHVDAAFGGFVIPFLKDIGYKLPDFDFKLGGVSSITIDPHKMGLVPVPAGGILFRKKEYIDVQSVYTPYLTEERQSTIVGTRTGASVAATWAMLKYMGREGYRKVVRECMETTKFLAKKISKIGLDLITKPELNIVAFDPGDTYEVAKKLENLGWLVSVSKNLDAIRIVVMPHITKDHVKKFIEDLEDVI
ncbi:Pyridoxal-dependent decarboxylase [Methanothermus fervidus DSM 2088]|uniref:Probable L-tyrosine/L-aspartate decarboxylase n=1 Tax=Methanothermus fervidus (strain ATCC 43054 / DSM 2088 / JCM 10308 / V24 S) TaxID=523846 RepID=E3GX95_METFV|nr:tyrosine decarboxylase MfnA [Methanothermus fervidus]ADP76927.1 Pyridoxal-dependent decarboxylase [Methanothermus fervidus DSM 2088]